MSGEDRILGCLLGGAIGDALGYAVEGQPGVAFREPDAFSVSDDTELTLATCEALGRAGRVIPEEIGISFREWFRAGRVTGVGASTLKALRDLSAGVHWALAGRKGDRAAGNGAAMRIAPIALIVDPLEPANRRLIRDVSRITHDNDEAYAGALAIAIAVHDRAVFDDNLLTRLAKELPDTRVRDGILKVAKFKQLSLQEVASLHGNSGYVAESVPFALCAAQRPGSFEAVVKEIVSSGGDTDTNASMFGQIVGARRGLKGLPERWLVKLPEFVRQKAGRFAAQFR